MAWMFAASAVLHLSAPHAAAVDQLQATAFIGYRVSGNEIALEWTGSGLLQASESVTGPWVTVTDAKSPYSAARVGGLQFYRLASTAHSVLALDATTIRVVYDRLMGLSAINPSNYAVSADDRTGIGILAARFGPLQSIVDLATTPQANADYQLTINNVQDSSVYDGSDAFAAPAGWIDRNGNNLRDRLTEVFQTGPDDYVLDPIRRDTDGDGIDDANEIVGFSITRITYGSGIFRGLNPVTGLSPNPLRPDTDGDTFLDGFERLVGLDPTDPEDLDTDGDGLPDPVEDAGWPVTTVAVSIAPFVDGLSSTNVVTSNKNSVDTDRDGLTDFEEFFLRTDPRSADSDRDGIHDILELRGYTLPNKVAGEDLGIITTLALDADTDNDKRADGDEAELISVELARWVVRVAGQTPYRVFSHPLLADADFDFVVDGDEFALDPRDPNRHTDPNNGNTDGDRRDDGAEISGRTNPLAVDLRVTVIAESVETSTPGQYNFALNVRPPDVSGVAGLGVTNLVFENVTATSDRVGRVRYSQDGVYIAGVYYRTSTSDTGVEENLTRDSVRLYDPGLKGILAGQRFEVRAKVSAGPDLGALPTRTFVYDPTSSATLKYQTSDILTSADFDFRGIESPVKNPQDFPLSGRSVRFGLADGERFSIEGFVQGFTVETNAVVKLGGLEGAKALQESTSGTPTEVRPVFSWIQVADKFLEEFYFEAVVNGATVKIKFYYLIE